MNPQIFLLLTKSVQHCRRLSDPWIHCSMCLQRGMQVCSAHAMQCVVSPDGSLKQNFLDRKVGPTQHSPVIVLHTTLLSVTDDSRFNKSNCGPEIDTDLESFTPSFFWGSFWEFTPNAKHPACQKEIGIQRNPMQQPVSRDIWRTNCQHGQRGEGGTSWIDTKNPVNSRSDS